MAIRFQKVADFGNLQSVCDRFINTPVVLFKHSTRCGISLHILEGLNEASAQFPEDWQFFLISVLDERPLSDEISARFKIPHQSPQALVILNGKCVWNASHQSVRPDLLLRAMEQKI